MKKILRYLTQLLSVLMLCFSCGQDDFKECTEGGCLIFEGDITTPDNTSLSNTDITLVYDETSIGVLLDDREVIGRTQTNDNGNYRISIDGNPYLNGNGFFDIKAAKTGYIERTIAIFDSDSIGLDNPIFVDFELVPEAFLELEFAISPDIRDLEYNLKVEYTNTFFSTNESTNLDSIYTYRVAGNQFIPIHYTYEKFGETLVEKDSIFIDQGLSKRLRIEID